MLASIETDKAVVDFEMQEEGFVAKLLFDEGAKDVPLGAPVAIIVESKDDVAAFANYDGASSSAAPAEPAPAATPAAAPASAPASSVSYPEHIALEMPNLSPTMEKVSHEFKAKIKPSNWTCVQGNIQKWHKAIGDEIAPGDVLASIETDKAVVDFEMQEEGYVAALLYPEGAQDVELGKIVAVLVEDKADVAAFKDYDPAAASGSPAPAEAAPTSEPVAAQTTAAPAQAAAPVTQTTASGDRVFASPLAKRLAEEKGLSLDQIAGTGPNNRIIAADVNEAQAQPKAQAQTQAAAPSKAPAQQLVTDLPSIAAAYEDLENSQIRKVIADRLTHSKQNIPHYYVTVSVQVDKLLTLRAKLNKHSTSKISVNDMVIKAASLAAVNVPATNSSWMGDFIREFKNVNMSVAVQTDHGLMAPVIANTNLKGLQEIATEIKDIAGRARENKLKPEELSGGTFTISNLGMYGVHNFSAIINPPQACILAVSGAEKKVVVNEKATGAEDQFKVASMMNVTLSSDHRVVDGAVAAMWGQEFKKFIENPELMLL